MNVDEMIAALNEIRNAKGGETPVAFWEYAGGLDELNGAKAVYDEDQGVALITAEDGHAYARR